MLPSLLLPGLLLAAPPPAPSVLPPPGEFAELLGHLHSFRRDESYVPGRGGAGEAPGRQPSERLDKVEQEEEGGLGAVLQSLANMLGALLNSVSGELSRRRGAEVRGGPELLLDTATGVVDSFTRDPQPPLIVFTLLLSLLSGTAIGNSLLGGGRVAPPAQRTAAEACPAAHQLVYIGEGDLLVLGEGAWSQAGPAPPDTEDGYYCQPAPAATPADRIENTENNSETNQRSEENNRKSTIDADENAIAEEKKVTNNSKVTEDTMLSTANILDEFRKVIDNSLDAVVVQPIVLSK